MSGDIMAFLNAQLDADERRANAMGHTDPDEGGFYACPATRPDGYDYGDLPSGEAHCDCGLAERKGKALRRVAAMRRRLERHQPRGDFCTLSDFEVDVGPWPCWEIRNDLLVFADRDGFDPRWVREEGL